MKRVVFKFEENPEVRAEFQNLLNEIDDEARYEHIAARLIEFFDQHPDAMKKLKRTRRAAKYR